MGFMLVKIKIRYANFTRILHFLYLIFFSLKKLENFKYEENPIYTSLVTQTRDWTNQS